GVPQVSRLTKRTTRRRHMSKLEGHIALVTGGNTPITGGNSGIGLVAAQEFDRESTRIAVKLAHVTRTYRRDAFEVRALDDVSLTIPTQGFVAIMGPSGSGKTTLPNLVAGIDHATSGSVVVGEEEITTMNERELAAWRARHIGLVFQFSNLIPVLTAFENVELPLLLT